MGVPCEKENRMTPDIAQIGKGQIILRGAYIFFSQKEGTRAESVYYNQEAWRIFSYATSDRKGVLQKSAFPNIGTLCLKWKKLMDKQMDAKTETGEREFSQFIDIYQSMGRRYLIRGILLSDYKQEGNAQPRPQFQYLFLLERIVPDQINLTMIARRWRFTPRERSIAHLLILDQSNKEIAHSLKISINTLKGYLKLLMRKLRVNSRAGIVACVLTGAGPEETKAT